MLKIFHTADVHLDAPFSLSDPVEAEKRRTGLRSTFCSMIHSAKRIEADVFLISGDLFEESFATKDTVNAVVREMESFPTCRFFIIPGNHDPYSDNCVYSLVKWPENVHIFTEKEPTYVDIPEKNARIYGHAYTSKDIDDGIFSGFQVEDKTKINILLAHGFVNMPQSACNVLMKADIENSGLDYIALGHIHTHLGFEKAGDTVYAYSGCAVGRSFDECGYKYAIIGGITKEDTQADVRLTTYKCSADRRFEIAKVDLSGAKSTDEALSVIQNACVDFGEDTSLRIILTGEVSPEVQILYDDVRRLLKAPQYIELYDETLPLFDAERLKNDMTIIGAFYRALEPKLMSDDKNERKKASLALRYGLAALCGRDING